MCHFSSSYTITYAVAITKVKMQCSTVYRCAELPCISMLIAVILDSEIVGCFLWKPRQKNLRHLLLSPVLRFGFVLIWYCTSERSVDKENALYDNPLSFRSTKRSKKLWPSYHSLLCCKCIESDVEINVSIFLIRCFQFFLLVFNRRNNFREAICGQFMGPAWLWVIS